MLRFEDVAVHYAGYAPVVLCSHHDGSAFSLPDDTLLPFLRGRHSDEGTRDLAFRTADVMRRAETVPHLLIFNIEIQRSTDEMFDLYLQKVFSVIYDCLNRFKKCFVIDFHRFYKHPEFTCDIRREYDIWFGTDHRNSVRNDFDRNLAAAIIETYKKLCGQEISIYVPEETEKIGESFGATGKSPERTILTKAISDTFFGQPVNAVQIEFYIDHLQKIAPRVKLAISFANALLKII